MTEEEYKEVMKALVRAKSIVEQAYWRGLVEARTKEKDDSVTENA